MKQKAREEKDPETMELATIGPKGTDKLSLSEQRRPVSNALDNSRLPMRNLFRNEHSDPLPLYSVDGSAK